MTNAGTDLIRADNRGKIMTACAVGEESEESRWQRDAFIDF